MNEQRILITGGAGFLGVNLLRHLAPQGYRITLLDLVPVSEDESAHATSVEGDVRDVALVDRVMKGQDLVVHAAAALPRYSTRDIHSTEVDGTRIVLEAALRHGVRRVVHVSSTAVYGIPDHGPIDENDRLRGVGPYGVAKIEAESVALDFRSRGLIVPILRPKSFIGPERLGVFDILFDWSLSARNFPVLGDGTNRYQLLHVEDLCKAISLCMTLPAEEVNDTFNIGAKVFDTVKSEYQAVLDEAGFGKRVVPLPAAPAIWALRILAMLHLSPLYPWVYNTAGKDSVVSIGKAERQLGFVPRFSNTDALLSNFHWYRDNRHRLAERHGGISHRDPWPQGALRLLKYLF